MDSESYELASYPAPFKILGQDLRAFSLGHFNILRRLKCCFVADETITGPLSESIVGDLIKGVLICSRSVSEAETLVRNIELMESLAEQLGNSNPYRSVVGLDDSVVEFQRYISEGSRMPGYYALPNESTPMQLNQGWVQNVLLSLVTNCGYTRTEALNAPLGQVLFDHLGYLEKQGAIRLVSAQELEEIKIAEAEELAAQQSEEKAEENKLNGNRPVTDGEAGA